MSPRDTDALPWRSVRHLCLTHGAWIVGSYALPGANPMEVRDVDVLVPPERWRAAGAFVSAWCADIAEPVRLTTFGGLRFTDRGTTVDVFTESLTTMLESPRLRALWHPATGRRLVVTP